VNGIAVLFVDRKLSTRDAGDTLKINKRNVSNDCRQCETANSERSEIANLVFCYLVL
jgi:hypothetical protein